MPPIPCANTPSAAKLLLQLCARRNTSSFAVPPSSSSILDILLPPRTRARTLYGSAVRGHALTMRTAPTANRSIANEDLRRQAIGSRRAFTTSRALAKTLAIHNPQKDDDGKDMLLEITPRAADRLSQIMSKDKNPYLALRIQVESGGCHGFQYLMSLTTLPSTLSSASQSATVPPLDPDQVAEDITPSTTTSNTPSPQALNEDDVIFSFASADEGPSLTSPKVVLDLPSLELLKGSKVDYTMELIGSQFKIVDNPLATSSCGCGTSFDIKI
ncbi:hypothetical protein GGR50DRAFT_151512 [Xylaria sp. CBS 124048]|nr:hypothetical protein GGR50DRAFT_151512 [Xylaria sp. CBS 124048]